MPGLPVSLGEPLARFQAIHPIRDGLGGEAKRDWLFARPSVQCSTVSIGHVGGEVKGFLMPDARGGCTSPYVGGARSPRRLASPPPAASKSESWETG